MTKIIFNQNSAADKTKMQTEFMRKQTFRAEDAVPDKEVQDHVTVEGKLLNEQFEQIMQPKPRLWKKLLGGAAVLFLGATVAQSVQWLIDTYQQNQWIYFAFAIVSCVFVLLGIGALVQELRRLRQLKQREQIKQKSAVDFQKVLSRQDFSEGKTLCLSAAKAMQIDEYHPAIVRWNAQINEAMNAKEVAYLFSQNVLQQIDKQAKKLISRTATEAAVVVAISPLAIVDMFFVAWRNLRLVNQIAKLYGIELGYFSRIRLLRMVLINIAFAGATELIHDVGMDWLSQDITAKLSARAAQGLGVGVLTARLGIKTMEFCRPLVFQADEKPKLSAIYRELLGNIKSTVLGGNKIKEKEKVK